MNYRHLFHAGNFADVVKHLTLIALINSLCKKDTPFCVLDTHAGKGLYDFMSEAAKKTREFEGGIVKVIEAQNPPPLVQQYLEIVEKFNLKRGQAKLRFYPGSPYIMQPLLRAQDRIVATELNEHEFEELKKLSAHDRQVFPHMMDGYAGLKAFLPPPERRGVVMIDPPYESQDEYGQIVAGLSLALKRWATGIYTVWYPIKDRGLVDRFQRTLKETLQTEILCLELSIHSEDVPYELNGCGMLVVNPPFKFDQEMQQTLPWLWKTLSVNHKGRQRLFTL